MVNRYGDLNGSHVLREAISRRLSLRYGGRIAPEQVCITNGGSEAIMLALHLLMQPGGELLMASSCYPGYRSLHSFFGATRRLVPQRPDFNIDVAALPSFVRDRAQVLIVNSPSNPFGSVLSEQDLEVLSELPLPIVFDEVYQPLPLDDRPLPSAVAFADRHFIVGSFAKSLAVPGLRLGYLVSPPEWAEEIVNIKALVSVCSSLAAQHVLEHLLVHWDELEVAHQAHLRANHAYFTGICNDLELPLVTMPRAGLFAAVALEADLDRRSDGSGEMPVDSSLPVALELAARHGIGVVPSADFQEQGRPLCADPVLTGNVPRPA